MKGNKQAFLKVAYASTSLERDLLLAELRQKEPAVAEWLATNLDSTQWQTAALGELGFKTYSIVTSNSAECLFAKLCIPAISKLSMRQMTAAPMITAMMELLQEQANFLRTWAISETSYVHRFSMHAMKDFMREANDSVHYKVVERARNEWIVRRNVGMLGNEKQLEAFRIVRSDPSLELGYECDCGRTEQRDTMCRHIIAVVKSSDLRRNLIRQGGIGNKWSTQKYKAFAEMAVRTPSDSEVMNHKPQSVFPNKIVLPPVSWKRGRPKKNRALSVGEKYHRAGLKKANLPLGSKVVICGVCQQPGHNRRTCQALTLFLATKSSEDMLSATN